MAECLATVVASEPREAGFLLWVRPLSPADCQACAEGRGCGGGLLAQALCREAETLPVPSAQAFALGQTVRLDVPDQALLRASLRFYLLPLAALLVTAALARALGLTEGLVILAGLLGLGGVLLFLALNSHCHGHTLLPITVRPLGTEVGTACLSVQNKLA